MIQLENFYMIIINYRRQFIANYEIINCRRIGYVGGYLTDLLEQGYDITVYNLTYENIIKMLILFMVSKL